MMASDHAPAPLLLATVSTVDALVMAVRTEILAARIAPGDRLNEVVLSRRFGVGRQTLRAALSELVHGGLLEQIPNRGTFVRRVEATDLDDLHRYRRIVELGALDLALERKSDFAEASAAAARLADLPPDAEWAAVTDAHNAIHAAIVAAAGSPRLAAAYCELESELALFVRQIRPDYPLERMIRLHRSLLRALRCDDPARARTALAADLDRGGATLRATFADRPASERR